MRDPIETGRPAHPKAEANLSFGEHPALRMPARLPRIEKGTPRPRLVVVIGGLVEGRMHRAFPPDDVKRVMRWPHRKAIKMLRTGREARQHASRFSVVSVLATLWRPF